MSNLKKLVGMIALLGLAPLIAGCKTRKSVYAKDLMFTTVEAANKKFHNNVQVGEYRFSHTIPDAKGKFAFTISPISSMDQITNAHSAIKEFMWKRLCPKYKNAKGKPYNFGAYSPASSKPSAPFAPMVRKDRNDAVVVGWCSIVVRTR